MSRMTIGVIATLIFGSTVGIVGGLILGEPWFHGGEVVFAIGFGALWVLALWKRPRVVLDVLLEESDNGEGSINNITASQFEAPVTSVAKAASPRK